MGQRILNDVYIKIKNKIIMFYVYYYIGVLRGMKKIFMHYSEYSTIFCYKLNASIKCDLFIMRYFILIIVHQLYIDFVLINKINKHL